MSDAAIRVEHVSKKFCRTLKRSLWYGAQDLASELFGRQKPADRQLRRDEFWAVRDLSFELKRGECLGLIGRNGAGKTTLLRMLNGLIKPDAGRIEIRGRVGALIALGAGFNPILTGRENIYVNGAVLGIGKQEIDAKLDEIIDFSELQEFIDTPLQSYSSGMQVRLGFAVASALNPDILLLDEVLAVGDVGFRAKCFNRLGQLRTGGTNFILVSHNTQDIVRNCATVAYLENGRIKHCGAPSDAIALYLEDIHSHNREPRRCDTAHSPQGTGRLRLVDVLVNSEKPPVSLKPGGSLDVAIAYENTCPADIAFVLDITLYDDDGVLFKTSFPNDMHGAELSAPSHCRNVLKLFFASIPSNDQQLVITYSLWNPAHTELFDWQRDIYVRCLRNAEHAGKSVLDCRLENITRT